MGSRQWVGIVRWKIKPGVGSDTQYFGPFDEYDTGIKVWSANFAAQHRGEFEWIDYADLHQPAEEWDDDSELIGLRKQAEVEAEVEHYAADGPGHID